MARIQSARLVGLLALCGVLAACEEGVNPFDPQLSTTPEADTAEIENAPIAQFIEQDVEAPEIFAANEPGLWDGRPSLGGVWIAYPDVPTPERVQITNLNTGEQTIGALFRRERDLPGPRIQVSSEAAVALGILAGQPTELQVVALKREQIEVTPPAPVIPVETESEDLDVEELEAVSIEDVPLAAPVVGDAQIEEDAPEEPEVAEEEVAPPQANLVDPAATAAAALAALATPPNTRPTPRPVVEQPAAVETASVAAAPAPEVQRPAGLPLGAPSEAFVQVGLFSVEGNAVSVGEDLRAEGILPTILSQDTGERTFWRVLVGPVTSVAERSAILERVKEMGHSDAFAVAN